MDESEIQFSDLIDCLYKNCISDTNISYIEEKYKDNSNIWNLLCVAYDLKLRGKRVKISKIPNLLEIVDSKGKVTDLIIIYTENAPLEILEMFKYLDLSKSMRVSIYLAIIDKYGDITYYNLSEVSLSK
ncbi:ribonuclease BN [Acidianus manzaensis]|nr:ribonuclease BN [Acidianus manzaensis]